MSKILLTIYLLLFLFFIGSTPSVYAQSDDFAVWTKMKVNHKLDSRFSISGDLELRTEDHTRAMDRLGLVVGGHYRASSFLNLHLGYETHYRNLGGSEWKFRYRYHLGATANFRIHQLKISLRERIQQTFDRGDSEIRLRSRLKLSYVPTQKMLNPYFSVEIYQSLDEAPFGQVARMRYRPGIDVKLDKCWALDTFYCYQYSSGKKLHIAGIEVAYSY